MTGGAVISDCGRFRYALSRGRIPSLAFVMLNPSTADALVDDPTIRRCLGFARREDYAGIDVVNLYALRATNPARMLADPDRIGPDNDLYLNLVARTAHTAVLAWGANAEPERAAAVIVLLRARHLNLVHLGLTKGGHPRHPLYVKGDQPLLPWED